MQSFHSIISFFFVMCEAMPTYSGLEFHQTVQYHSIFFIYLYITNYHSNFVHINGKPR